MSKIKKVGVLGSGLMGSGIAEVAARAGYETVVREVTSELVDRGAGQDPRLAGQGGGEGQARRRRPATQAVARLSGTVDLATSPTATWWSRRSSRTWTRRSKTFAPSTRW